MQVSTHSWHYRLIDWLDFNHPNNLCAYCWKTVWSIFVAGAAFPVAVIGGVILVTMPIWHMFFDRYLVDAAAFVAVIEILGLLILLYNLVSDRRKDEIYAGERECPEPSLAYVWIKAQHDKVCPLIRFVSE